MSFVANYANQPPTTVDDDLQANMEAQGIQEPDVEGEGEHEEAEEPESANDDDPQGIDESDDFDEDAIWGDVEEDEEYDIYEMYNFVWSEYLMGEPTAYVGDSMTIWGSADRDQEDKPFKCTAAFAWCEYIGEFTCIHRPETQTFADFKAKRNTLDGGMEQLLSVKIRMWEESCRRESDILVRTRKEIKDDRGHLFLFVRMELGGHGMDENSATVYGKKLLEEQVEDSAVLTEGEKERLRLP